MTKTTRKLVAVMFTDIVGYTALVQQDERMALAKMARHEELVKAKAAQHGGRAIKFYGDGSLSIYDSAVAAVRSAIEMQTLLRQENIAVRIGIHLGDVVIRDNDVFGDGVNIASRIESLGVAGGVLISDRVHQELRNQADIQTKNLGGFNLKNVQEKVQILAIHHPDLVIPPFPGLFKMWQRSRKWPTVTMVVIGLLLVFSLFQQIRSKSQDFKVSNQESVAVPSFENLTGLDSLDFIAKMAAHWITNGLSEMQTIPVTSFESLGEVPVVLSSAFSVQQFGEKSGAVNLVSGSYSRDDHNNLIFNTYLKEVRTGKVLPVKIPVVTTSIDDPLPGIHAILNALRGYYASRDLHLSSIPNYSAYKAFIAAKEQWNLDNEAVESLLKQAIREDSTFYDSYFLLSTLYTNQGRNLEAMQILNQVKLIDLSDRQKNILRLRKARLQGDNVEAFKYSFIEYTENPRDLFNNTSAMVFALEYVNEPGQVIEIFNKIPIENFDLSECKYCQERLYIAMKAQMKLNNYAEAKKLSSLFPTKLVYRAYYAGLCQLAAYESDTSSIERHIERAKSSLPESDCDYLYYLTAEYFKLLGNEPLKELYAQKTVEAYKGSNNRTLARALYLLNRFEESRNIFDTLLKETPHHLGNLAKRALISTKTGDLTQAKETIKRLEGEHQAFQYGETFYLQAKIHVSLGESEQALDKLQRARDEGSLFTYWTWENDPDLISIFENERFNRMIHPLR